MDDMDGKPESKRAPVCGVLSVAAPFVSAAVFYVVRKIFISLRPNDDNMLYGIAFIGLPVVGCFFAGLILATFATLGREKWPTFPLIGLLLNSSPLLYSCFQ